MGTKLYVGNLNYNTNEESLRQMFGSNGREVASVSIIMDRETGRSRGFAFVEMTTAEFAQQALKELDGADLDGRALRINEARERDARGPGGPPRSFGGPRPDGGGFGGPPAGGGGGGNFGPPRAPGGGNFGPPRAPGGGNFGPPRAPGGGAGDDRKRGGGGPGRRGERDEGKRGGGGKRRGGDDEGW
jgi:RNA recognition motif-containing protein